MSKFKSLRLSPASFSLLKADSLEQLVFTTYKSTTFATLKRECGTFFENPIDGDMPVVVNPMPPILVPKALYRPPALRYISPQITLSENDVILEDEIDDYLALYPFPHTKIMQLQSMGVRPKFHHLAKLLYTFLRQQYQTVPARMILFADGQKVDFVLFKDSKLQIINSFGYSSVQDLLFFVLNILQQFELPLSDTLVLYSGTFVEAKSTIAFMSDYIPHFYPAGEQEPIHVSSLNGTPTTLAACLPEYVLFSNMLSK